MDDTLGRDTDAAAKRRALLEALLQKQNLVNTNATKIPRRKDTGPAPLSFAQERLWFLDQFYSGGPTYNISVDFILRGRLNIEVLQESVNLIIQRHEILRTTFTSKNGIPVQVVAPTLILSLPIVDLRSMSDQAQSEEVHHLLQVEAQQTFDLKQGPLMRVILLYVSDNIYHLVVTLHHIIFDAWSMGVFIRELIDCYTAYLNMRAPLLPTLAIQYVDYACWQREWLSGSTLNTQLEYWREQLASLTTLTFPTTYPRPSVQTFNGSNQRLQLPKSLLDSLIAVTQSTECTLFMTLLSAFTVLLHRYTGQDDIAIGSPVANRTRSELDNMIGFFVNTVVLRTDMSGNPSFRELLSRVRKTTLNANSHQDVPFEKLVEVLQPERDLSRTPLFQVAFTLQNANTLDLNLPGMTIQAAEVRNETAKFDLTLVMEESPHGLLADMEYNTDLFDSHTIKRMLGHLGTLLHSVADNVDQPLASLPLLTPAEQCDLKRWNDTVRDFPRDRCLHEMFEAQVDCSPLNVATVFRDQSLTYDELNQRANKLAHYLRSLGVGAEVVVGICMEGSLELVVAILAILKAGGAYLPLDPRYPRERLDYMLQDSDVHLVLTQQHFMESIVDAVELVVSLDGRIDDLEWQPYTNPPTITTPDNMCYIIYTSGSTGRPKGVVLQHQGVVNLILYTTALFPIDSESQVLQFASFSFDASVREVFEPLLAGGTLHLERRDSMMPGDPLLELFEKSKISAVTLAPSIWGYLPQVDLPYLRTAIAGGEACTAHIVNRWAAERRFFNAYGPTEITVASSVAECFVGSKPTIGHPMANVQYYVVDRQLQRCPIGIIGELLIGGVGLARGYMGRPDLTAERFIPNPFSTEPGSRVYCTGDVVRLLPDGDVDYLGRIDNQVKIRGFRIELGEIEAVLLNHRNISAATVICPDNLSGEKQLVAYVVSPETIPPTPEELQSFMGTKLPHYMVPAIIVFLDTIPLTTTGKVDVRALPSPGTTSRRRSYTAPRDPVEQVVAGIWATILKIDRVGVYDNFFELGGHSLLVTQVIARIRDTFGIELQIITIFESPSVAALTQSLVKDSDDGERVAAIAQLMVQVDELGDDEIAQLLQETLLSQEGGIQQGGSHEG